MYSALKIRSGGYSYNFYSIQGAYVGFLTGLAATMWLGIGAQVYKPPVWKPPVSTAGCVAENITSLTTAMFTTTTEATILPSEK